jgi:hypothetical protein
MIIGLVTSTKFSGKFRDALLKGLRAHGWEGDPGATPGGKSAVSIAVYEADGSYDDGEGQDSARKELYNAVSAYDADVSINLIIAVGGLVSAHAAYRRSQRTPFLVLFGNTPKFDLDSNPNFRGGVNLAMLAKDVERHDQLCSMFGISDPKKVALIWNSKSKMGRDEKEAWVKDNRWPLHQEVKKNADDDIGSAFVKAKASGAKGIVISGDPFFTSRMNEVVTAGNASRLKICYPFAVYKNATPAPTPGSGLCLGPDLEDAYATIGQKAGTILTALADGASAPSTGLDEAKTGKAQPLGKGAKASNKKTSKKKY